MTELLLLLPAQGRTVLFSALWLFFSLCQHDNLWSAALSLMKFCTNMYYDNL